MRGKRYNMRVYLQPAFLICIAVLAIGEIIKPILGVVIPDKEPLPLKKPLDLLDEKDLSHYKVISKIGIENRQIIKELGTEDYIQWVLEDTDVKVDSVVRKFLLFITYYEFPGMVVHAPEECYTGGGYQSLSSDNITCKIDNNAGFRRNIQGKYIVFGSNEAGLWQNEMKFPVLYFFNINGKYVGSREEARMALNKNLFGKYSYFCKVELAFNQNIVMPDKEEAISAGQKLLGVILPILETEHWPDWKKEDGGE